jgi:hypothetical protein
MQEGQEILTSQRPVIDRYPSAIAGLSGIILLFIDVIITLVSDSEFVFFSKLGMTLILMSVFIFIMKKVIVPLTNKTYKPSYYYKVIYFSDRLMFKRYTENGASESNQIYYPQIESLNQENNRIKVKLVFGQFDDKIQKLDEHYNWLSKGSTTSEIEKQEFRISKKLSKNDRSRLLDVLKIHIERAKERKR